MREMGDGGVGEVGGGMRGEDGGDGVAGGERSARGEGGDGEGRSGDGDEGGEEGGYWLGSCVGWVGIGVLVSLAREFGMMLCQWVLETSR